MANAPLQLTFHSDTTAARNDIANLAGVVTKNMVTIGDAMKTAANHSNDFQKVLSRIPSLAGAALTGLVAFGAATLAFHLVRDSIQEAIDRLEELVKIGRDAATAGVGTNFFQAWTKQAHELGVETETLVRTLNKARESATVNLGHEGQPNQSSAQELLGLHARAGNIGQGDVTAYNAATSLENQYRVVLDLLDKLQSQGRDLARFDIAKGFFGEDFETMLRNGVDAVGNMRKALDGVEKVKWPPDIVQKAKEINDQLEKADKTLREGWWPIQQDIERLNQKLAGYWADIKTYVAESAASALSFYENIKAIGDIVDKIKTSDFFIYATAVGNLVSRLGTVPSLIGDLTGGRPVGSGVLQPPGFAGPSQYGAEYMGEYGRGGSGRPEASSSKRHSRLRSCSILPTASASPIVRSRATRPPSIATVNNHTTPSDITTRSDSATRTSISVKPASGSRARDEHMSSRVQQWLLPVTRSIPA